MIENREMIETITAETTFKNAGASVGKICKKTKNNPNAKDIIPFLTLSISGRDVHFSKLCKNA